MTYSPELPASFRRHIARTKASADLTQAARKWAIADGEWVTAGSPPMGRNAFEARLIRDRAEARRVLLSAASDFANL